MRAKMNLFVTLLNSLVIGLPGCTGSATSLLYKGADIPPPAPGGSYLLTSALYAAEPLVPPAWQPNTNYAYGQRVSNGGRLYQATNPGIGTSASSGGPSCTSGTCATDGTVTWRYSASSQGPIYYACDCASGLGMTADPRCVQGNDTSNTGTSPSSPFRAFSRAMAQLAAVPAGGMVALCRGGVIAQNIEADYSNVNCTEQNPCTLRDYYPPWDNSGTAAVTNPEGVSYQMPAITSSGYSRTIAYWRNATHGLRVMNLYLKSTRGTGQVLMAFGPGPNVTGLTINNVVVDGFGTMAQGDVTGTINFSMLGSKVIYSSGSGPTVGGDNLIVVDNYFSNVGAPIYNHSIYLGTHGFTAHNVRVTGNEIYHNAEDANGNCTSAPIVMHGEFENLLIENNLIYQAPGKSGAGCWGIALDSGGYCAQFGTPTWFRYSIIRRNRIFNVGNTGIEVSQCSNCLIENNLIVQTPGSDWGGGFGIYTGWATASSSCGSLGGDDKTTGVTIRNNTIYDSGTDNTSIGVYVNHEGTGHNVTGNAVYMPVGSCYTLGSGASLGYASNNACYGGATFSAPFNTAGVTGDPSFTNPTTDPVTSKFLPVPESPLVNAGSTATTCTVLGVANSTCSSTIDLTGKPRDASPDIGAYEQ